MTYAYVEQSNSDGRWYVRPLVRGFLIGMKREEAEHLAMALNAAHLAGKEQIRSELRDLLGVDHAKDY